jgi:hypothetical protein
VFTMRYGLNLLTMIRGNLSHKGLIGFFSERSLLDSNPFFVT